MNNNQTPETIRLYCNHNLKCPQYWNHDKCIASQNAGTCAKQQELAVSDKQVNP
jgi:hypothetical protein